MTSQWLLCLLSDFAQILHRDAAWYSKQTYKILLRLIEKWRYKWSSLILRTQFVKSTLQRMCCHGNMKHCILLQFCTEVLIIVFKDSSKLCEDWLRNSVTVTSLLSWMGWFCIIADSKMCCHGNINSSILLSFRTKIQLSISNKITIFC